MSSQIEGLSGLLKSSKKPPLIHQTEARLIRLCVPKTLSELMT